MSTLAVVDHVRLLVAARLVALGYEDSGFEARLDETDSGIDATVWTPHCLQGQREIWDGSLGDAASIADPVAAARAVLADHRFLDARTRRHLGCFHRRSKGMARVVTRLVVDARLSGDPAASHLRTLRVGDALATVWLEWGGDPYPPSHAGRHHALLDASGDATIIVRTDGLVLRPGRRVDLRTELWHAVDDSDVDLLTVGR